MQRFKVLAASTAMAATALLAAISPISAQDATPTVDMSPNADECTLQPRTIEELQAVYGTPAAEHAGEATSAAQQATPAITTLPTGSPADAATVDAVTKAIRTNIACYNAGNYLAAFAGVTDEFLISQVGSSLYDADFVAAMEATPVPLPEDQQTVLLGVRNVIVLADGRVAALVDYHGVYPQVEGINGVETDLWIFKQVDGQWLLDEVQENLEGLFGPTATPAA